MVMRSNKCRVCKEYIPVWDWKRHVEVHKKDFCRSMNLDLKYWFEVSWENVVKFFNPGNVVLVGGDKKIVRKPKVNQKFLDDFLK